MAEEQATRVTAWTVERIKAEHPPIPIWVGNRLEYGALDTGSDAYVNIYIRLAHGVVRQPFTWETLLERLNNNEPLVAG